MRDPKGPVTREIQTHSWDIGERPQPRVLGPPMILRRDGRAAQGIGLLNRRGANRRAWVRIPLSPPLCRTRSSEAERRSYKAEVLGSIPSACTTQRDVSSA